MKLSNPPNDFAAQNYGSFEYARVPEGVRLDTCAPDFDHWRRTGEVVCNEATVHTITADADARACPGSKPFSLLDCLRPLQHDAATQKLVIHFGAMHFGTSTWQQICPQILLAANQTHDVTSSASIQAQLCRDTDAYSIDIPVAADVGSTSLVRYSFLPGYGCSKSSDLDNTERLSRLTAPNMKISCPTDPHGTYTHSNDGLRCELT